MVPQMYRRTRLTSAQCESRGGMHMKANLVNDVCDVHLSQSEVLHGVDDAAVE
jgi:hypothetical protein